MTKEFLPIPPIESATDPIGSAADLRQRWRAVMGELGFGERLLWFAFVGPDRRLTKVISQVPIGARPAAVVVDPLMLGLTVLLDDADEGSTVALLLTRPGGGTISNADRRWADALIEAAQRFGVPIEPIFRANDEAVILIEPESRAA
jgi:hypothetical protein